MVVNKSVVFPMASEGRNKRGYGLVCQLIGELCSDEGREITEGVGRTRMRLIKQILIDVFEQGGRVGKNNIRHSNGLLRRRRFLGEISGSPSRDNAGDRPTTSTITNVFRLGSY